VLRHSILRAMQTPSRGNNPPPASENVFATLSCQVRLGMYSRCVVPRSGTYMTSWCVCCMGQLLGRGNWAAAVPMRRAAAATTGVFIFGAVCGVAEECGCAG
jgi:hypothetical protein